MTYDQRIKELLSVKLISEVLGDNKKFQSKHFQKFKIEDNTIVIYFSNFDSTGITGTHWSIRENLDTFCFKCIDYAMDNYGISLYLFVCADNTATCEIHSWTPSEGWNCEEWFNIETKQESILKATNWVRENR